MKYKSTIKLGDKSKLLVVVSPDKKEKVAVKKVDNMHFIQIIDRSLSMTQDIDDLIENVKQTIDSMSDKDYVSIIWFSSQGQIGVPIKGAKKDESLYRILDGLKSTIGQTCFSEAVEESSKIVSELKAISSNISVSLFTDGEAVTSWSDEEEYSKVYSLIEGMKDDIIAFNTIGYGNSYNQEFLKKCSSITQFGNMIHSSVISDYFDIFKHNESIERGLVLDKLEVESPSGDIVYFSSKSSKIYNGSMNLRFIDGRKNQLIFVLDKDEVVTINGEQINTADITKPVPSRTLIPVLYAYAYDLFYDNRVAEALDVIISENIGDKKLANSIINAFTYQERADVTKLLRKRVFSAKERELNTCDSSFIPDDNATTVMDIIGLLSANKARYVPDSKNYKRISVSKQDTFKLFQKDKTFINSSLIDDNITYEKTHMNVSIKYTVRGSVKLNPNEAKRVDLPLVIENIKKWQTHTIIKDGNLNTPIISVAVGKTLLEQLEEIGRANKGFIMNTYTKSLIIENSHKVLTTIVKLDLSVLPIINRRYAKFAESMDNILDLVVEATNKKALRSVLKYIKSNIPQDIVTGYFNSYSPEQVEVLKAHNIDQFGYYHPLESKTKQEKEEDKAKRDFYTSRGLDFQLKGFASVPSMNKVLSSPNSKANNILLVRDKINEVENKLDINIDIPDSFKKHSNEVDEMLSDIQSDLESIREKLAISKIAVVLTHNWFPKLPRDKKGNAIFTKDDKTLVIKASRTKVYFN